MNTRYLCRPATWFSIIAGGVLDARRAGASRPRYDRKTRRMRQVEKFVVTGSLIKRLEGEGALPCKTRSLRSRWSSAGIASAEQ